MGTWTETLNRVLAGDYDEASEEERHEAVRNLVEMCSAAAAAAAIQPIPFMDTLLISPIQVGLVQGIGRIHGHRLDRKAIIEIIGSFGASIVAQNLILAATKFIPVAGWVAGAAMAYALTWAIGDVAAYYFEHGRGVAPEELRSRFKKAFESKRAEKVAAHKGDASLKERLEQLKEARAAELLTEEEFEAKKREILDGF